MTLERVRRGEAIDRKLFHQRLRQWVTSTSSAEDTDPMVGPVGEDGVKGNTCWVHVRDDAGNVYGLHADVRRSSVSKYLDLVEQIGDALTWTVVLNQRGNLNAVAYGPDAVRLTPFYLYLVKHR